MKLQLIKKSAIAAALSVVAAAASAMTPIQDEALSQVSGQDGVNIGVDLNVRVGEFRYTNTNGTWADSIDPTTGAVTPADTSDDASISFRDIRMNGAFAMSMEVLQNELFNGGAGVGEAYTVLGLTGGADAGTFHDGTQDVVKIAIPQLESSKKLNFSVGAITMGTAGTGAPKSYGSIAMNDIRLQGTKVYIWAK